MCSVNWRWSFRENRMQNWNHIDSYNNHYQIRDIHLDLQGIHSTHSSKNAEKSQDSPTNSGYWIIHTIHFNSLGNLCLSLIILVSLRFFGHCCRFFFNRDGVRKMNCDGKERCFKSDGKKERKKDPLKLGFASFFKPGK
ncbi:hypothetical protein AtEden1_Chr3g0162801 [Arabidopsis thaliana]